MKGQLVEYAREQIGDGLRTVAVLYEDDCETIYLRDDIREAYSADRYQQVAESFRTELNTDIYGTRSSEIGEKAAIIHSHEGAYVFQFPHNDCHSILLSVEPHVGSQLKSFIEGCQNQL